MRFQYLRPKSFQQAVAMMATVPDYALAAGGTDLMVKLKNQLVRPAAVIDISRLQELNGIDLGGDRIRIGASVTHTELCESAVIRQYAPALAAAAGLVGSPQIRNQGTVGGNIGNASPAADTVPVLMAYGAQVKIGGPDGEREVLLQDMFTGPGRTVLRPGEIITAIVFNAQRPNQGCSFQKMGKRQALSIAVVNAAAFLEIDAETRAVTVARLAFGSVAPTAVRMAEAETAITGQPVSAQSIQQAAALVSGRLRPIDDLRSTAAYRQEVAGVLIKRALEEAWKQIG